MFAPDDGQREDDFAGLRTPEPRTRMKIAAGELIAAGARNAPKARDGEDSGSRRPRDAPTWCRPGRKRRKLLCSRSFIGAPGEVWTRAAPSGNIFGDTSLKSRDRTIGVLILVGYPPRRRSGRGCRPPRTSDERPSPPQHVAGCDNDPSRCRDCRPGKRSRSSRLSNTLSESTHHGLPVAGTRCGTSTTARCPCRCMG